MSDERDGEAAAAQVKDFLDGTFEYHKPFGDQPTRYGQIRGCAKTLAACILANTPSGSREQGLALDALRSAVMWANSAIACNEKEPEAVPAEAGSPVPSVAPQPAKDPVPAEAGQVVDAEISEPAAAAA